VVGRRDGQAERLDALLPNLCDGVTRSLNQVSLSLPVTGIGSTRSRISEGQCGERLARDTVPGDETGV